MFNNEIAIKKPITSTLPSKIAEPIDNLYPKPVDVNLTKTTEAINSVKEKIANANEKNTTIPENLTLGNIGTVIMDGLSKIGNMASANIVVIIILIVITLVLFYAIL